MVKELTVGEAFDQAFENIREKLNGKEVILPESPWAEIGNDSDYHRTKVGYSIYKKVMAVVVDGKEYVIALGVAGGDYPSAPYSRDIVALRISSEGKSKEEFKEAVRKELVGSCYFRNSVAIAMASGTLRINPKSPFADFVLKAASTWSPDKYVARPVEYHENILTLDLRPAVKFDQHYTEQFPAHLSDMICAAIAASI